MQAVPLLAVIISRHTYPKRIACTLTAWAVMQVVCPSNEAARIGHMILRTVKQYRKRIKHKSLRNKIFSPQNLAIFANDASM